MTNKFKWVLMIFVGFMEFILIRPGRTDYVTAGIITIVVLGSWLLIEQIQRILNKK